MPFYVNREDGDAMLVTECPSGCVELSFDDFRVSGGSVGCSLRLIGCGPYPRLWDRLWFSILLLLPRWRKAEHPLAMISNDR